MNVPKTAFSLLYNATSVSAYRREAHEDIKVSFERFGIADGAVRDACIRMENASYDLRVTTVDAAAKTVNSAHRARYQAARQELDEATSALFKLIEGELAWLLINYAEVGGKPPYVDDTIAVNAPEWFNAGGLCLDLIYYCLFVRDFAASLEQVDLTKTRVDKPLAHALELVVATIADGQSPDVAEARECVQIICKSLATEYKERGWVHCW